MHMLCRQARAVMQGRRHRLYKCIPLAKDAIIQVFLVHTHRFILSIAFLISESPNFRLHNFCIMLATSSSAIPGHDRSARSNAFFSSSAASVLCIGRPLRK